MFTVSLFVCRLSYNSFSIIGLSHGHSKIAHGHKKKPHSRRRTISKTEGDKVETKEEEKRIGKVSS